MKKIAFFTEELEMGGTEIVLLNLLKRMDYSQYDVTVFVKTKKGVLAKEFEQIPVKIFEWGKYENREAKSYAYALLKKRQYFKAMRSIFFAVLCKIFAYNTFYNLKYYLKAVPFSEEKYDISVGFKALSFYNAMYSAFGVLSTQNIAWIHGNCDQSLESWFNDYYKLCYKAFNTIVCVSESVRSSFGLHFPEIQNRIKVIYNLFDIKKIREKALEKIEVPSGKIIFTTVARLTPEKGVVMIPQIAKKLRKQGIIFTWYVVGDGRLQKDIKSKIEEYQLGDSVRLLGNKMNPYPYIYACDVYIQPSYTEGFCGATLEAKILKKPVVVTDVSGMREQFTESEAVFCDTTVDSLLKGIMWSISNIEHFSLLESSELESYNDREIAKINSLFG